MIVNVFRRHVKNFNVCSTRTSSAMPSFLSSPTNKIFPTPWMLPKSPTNWDFTAWGRGAGISKQLAPPVVMDYMKVSLFCRHLDWRADAMFYRFGVVEHESQTTSVIVFLYPNIRNANIVWRKLRVEGLESLICAVVVVVLTCCISFSQVFWVAILIAILVVVRYVFENMHPSHFIYIHAKCHSHHFLNSRFHGKQFLWASNPLRQEHPHASLHVGHLARLPWYILRE